MVAPGTYIAGNSAAIEFAQKAFNAFKCFSLSFSVNQATFPYIAIALLFMYFYTHAIIHFIHFVDNFCPSLNPICTIFGKDIHTYKLYRLTNVYNITNYNTPHLDV